jgi:hypothetical protein
MANTLEFATVTGPVDCACVIHGDAYKWVYVDRLYNMLSRHITAGIRMHVFTEEDRPVPAHMIKHVLLDWEITGPKQSWWYKMQLFNPEHHAGPLLYFDLDTVIVSNIDWIYNLPLRYFWTVRDFKYLWNSTHYGINSSIMWWDTQRYDYIWNNFKNIDIKHAIKRWRGDQDYITDTLNKETLRFFEPDRVQSWRWQCLDGGYNFKHKIYQAPNTGTVIKPETSVLIFHGKPKPDLVADSAIQYHWR